MPPEFVPSERRKKRETPSPKEPQSVDDLVNDIMRKYREEQQKLGNVDNWGQPNEKLDRKKVEKWVEEQLKKLNDNEKKVRQRGEQHFSPKAAAESLAEAIKNRLPEKKTKTSEQPRQSTPRESERSRPTSSERRKTDEKAPSTKERRERLGPKTHMQYPEVRGQKVTSKEQLRDLTNGEYSALKKKKDFPKRMQEAETHLDLMRKYAGRERVPHGEIARIAKNLGVDRETVSNWVTKGMTPRLYSYMNWSTPKSEATEKVRQIQEANNGIRNTDDVQKRLDTYYLGKEERESHFYERELKKMDKYFEFLELYKQGGMHLDIAKEAGLSESGAGEYLNGGRPWLVRLAVQIPQESPQEGYKWLPKSAGRNAIRDDWIQVPEKITDYKQVMDVIRQLKPLDNEDMKKWDLNYGDDYSLEQRFMHFLGTYVSDSNVPSSSTSAISFGMNLSKGYDWSRDFGEASCYHLGCIGIRAHRVSDVAPNIATIMTPYGEKKIIGKEQYQWMSENSPILRWIRKSCLGYDDSPKTYQKTDAEWIPRAPENLRSAFLQGLSDGDGGVSTRGYYFVISTHSDHDFVEKLLKSFGVDTYRSRTFVRTASFDAVKQVEKIPPFKYATERQEALKKTVRMIESRRNSWKSKPLSKDEINFM
jgi:hypothetical protein